MFITKKAVSRRTILRGMGATLALPLLDAMLPALGAQTAAKPVVRFGAIYHPHGNLLSQWTPQTTGANFAFTPILSPFEKYRDRLTVVSGLTLGPTVQNGGHAVAPASYLTGNIQPKQTEGNDIYASVTVDQLIARKIGQDTLLPSIEIAIEDFSTSIGACDTGYSCTYMNTISWSGPTTPMPMETNPRVVFDRLFGGGGTPEQRLARIQENKSILDSVTESVKSFERGLGTRDRAKLTDYLDHVREIERRIGKAEQVANNAPISIDAPVGPPELWDEHVDIMLELMSAAFQADVTRVFTFMMARDVTSMSFPHIGVPDPHHALSHEANGRSDDPNKKVRFVKVNTHFGQRIANFVGKLQSTPDGEGTLLDHSMIVYGSGMGNANEHAHHPVPFTIAGAGAGTMKKLGHHVAFDSAKLEPSANLMLALAQKAGVETNAFGLSTGPLDI